MFECSIAAVTITDHSKFLPLTRQTLIKAIPCADWLCSHCVWQSEISPEAQITKLTCKASKKLFWRNIERFFQPFLIRKGRGLRARETRFTPLACFARPISDLWKNVERVAVKVLHRKIWIWNWMVQYRLGNDFFDPRRRLSVQNRNPFGKIIFGHPTPARNLPQWGRSHSRRVFRESACPAFWFRSLRCHSWVFGGKTVLWPIQISRYTLSW